MGIEFKIPWYQKPIWWFIIFVACVSHVVRECWLWCGRQFRSSPTLENKPNNKP